MNKQVKHNIIRTGALAPLPRFMISRLVLSFLFIWLTSVWGGVMGQATLPDTSTGNLSLNQVPEKSIAGDYRHFELDRLGNVFLIGAQGNQITKYNQKGEAAGHYDNVRSYGQISALDVTNPLKIAVYYKDFATIVALDRYLSPVNTIDLRKADIWEAQAIATSYDNQYWVYDKQEAKIKKIDGQGKQTFVSSDLRQAFDEGIDPVKLLDRDGLLYTYDPAFGWYIFDYYGALKQKIPVQGLQDLQVTGGLLSGRKDNRLWWMTTNNNFGAASHWMDLSTLEGKVHQSMLDGHFGKLWLLTDKGVFVYALQNKH